MIEPFHLLERQTWIAPLGVRFRDASTGALVRGGLRVIAYPDAHRLQWTRAVANHSGAYVLHHAWGMREFELGVRNEPFPESPPPRHRYTIVVNDEERRFLPTRFEADLPTVGFFQWTPAGARTTVDPIDGSVPLYPSILGPFPPGMAVLRAELYESSSEEINGVRVNKPAAWAMIEAHFNGRLLGRGIADGQGRIALVFAYPPPRDSVRVGGSPLGVGTARLPFLKQEWTIQLHAFYQPSVLSLPGPSGSVQADDLTIPKLNDIFDQSPASLFLDEAETEPLTEVNLKYGPQVFVPPGSPVGSPPNPTPLSILFVSPTG